MANVTGYAIIQNAIPAELALQAADLIPGKLGVIVKRDEFTEFEIPRICLEIGKEFMKVCLLILHSLCMIITNIGVR